MIKKKKHICLVILSVILLMGCKENQLEVRSPGNINVIKLSLDDSGSLHYQVGSHGKTALLPSALGFTLANDTADFNKGLTLVKVAAQNMNETYHLPTGKRSDYTNTCRQKTFTFRNKKGEEVSLICRAYDDGIAFRYVMKKPGKITITRENTQFHIPPHTTTWMMDFIPSYENFYPKRTLDTIGNRELSYPALLHVGGQVWMLMTEASVYDQPATHLRKINPGNQLEVALPQQQYQVDSLWQSPWRTFILGTTLKTIVESTIVENLNPPAMIKDQSWIKPGVAVFPWWGNYLANSYKDTLENYVDLAAEMGWTWIEFDVSLVGSPWHTAKKWETTSWLPEFTAYAKSKGVQVYGWDEMKILHSPQGRKYIFDAYKKLGIKGIKIDYINSDQADVVRFRDSALADAAKAHLLVSFHGETAPRGMRRKWPNMMTEEAVRGAEYYTFKDAAPPSPTHNCTLPFTRNVIGAMDYTPVTFTIRPENPRQTTYAHELALPIIFESGWTVMADRPDMYRSSPAKAMLEAIKTTWDDIHFIAGYPGKYVCLARRKGADWYMAAINAGPARTIDIPLSFIRSGRYPITLYQDDPVHPLTQLNIRERIVNNDDTLHLQLEKNGGFSTIIHNAY